MQSITIRLVVNNFVSKLQEKMLKVVENVRNVANATITVCINIQKDFLSLVALQVGNSVQGALKDPIALANGGYVQCDNTRFTPLRYPYYSYQLYTRVPTFLFFFVCLY